MTRESEGGWLGPGVAVMALVALAWMLGSTALGQTANTAAVSTLETPGVNLEDARKAAEDIEAERQSTIRRLIPIVGDREYPNYQRASAAKALGSLRAVEAVEVLLDNLMEIQNPEFRDEYGPTTISPCARSLGQIGSPAVEKILERLRGDESDRKRWFYYGIMVAAEGDRVAFVRLEMLRARRFGTGAATAAGKMLEMTEAGNDVGFLLRPVLCEGKRIAPWEVPGGDSGSADDGAAIKGKSPPTGR